MIKYFVKRLISMIPVLLGVLTLTFFLSRFMPGDPALAFLHNRIGIIQGFAVPEAYEQIRHELWLDRPLLMQYIKYIADLFSGNWGYSIAICQGQEVWSLIMERLPRTMDIAIFSMIIASFLGVKVGIVSATNRNKPKDTLIRGLALLGVSIPVFYLGTLLQYFFGYRLSWFPATGFKNAKYGNPQFITGFRIIDSLISGEVYFIPDYLYHLILPVSCLSFITLAGITRQSRSSVLEILEQDYIRTARAKGCSEKDVIYTHVKKNSLIPTVTVIGLNFASLLTGAVLTEVTFGLKGIAQLLIDSIYTSEYWVLNALVFIFTLIFISINLLTDIIYAFVDPRIRY